MSLRPAHRSRKSTIWGVYLSPSTNTFSYLKSSPLTRVLLEVWALLERLKGRKLVLANPPACPASVIGFKDRYYSHFSSSGLCRLCGLDSCHGKRTDYFNMEEPKEFREKSEFFREFIFVLNGWSRGQEL